jgi:hypothetical protein
MMSDWFYTASSLFFFFFKNIVRKLTYFRRLGFACFVCPICCIVCIVCVHLLDLLHLLLLVCGLVSWFAAGQVEGAQKAYLSKQKGCICK